MPVHTIPGVFYIQDIVQTYRQYNVHDSMRLSMDCDKQEIGGVEGGVDGGADGSRTCCGEETKLE